MSLENQYKINNLLKEWPKGTVYLTSWLTNNGYSNQLLNRYKNSNWIETVGLGAVKQSGDVITVEGALYALQKQAGGNIHPGGKTALSMLGKSHYLEFSTKRMVLFGDAKEKLPSWMANYHWGVELEYFGSSFLPDGLGLVQKEVKNFTINISGAPRALMECLYLAPKKQDLIECYELMEGLNNLRPNSVQQLLEKCSSVKVKRLFLYMAEKAQHPWLDYLDLQKIDLGKGNRSLVENGVYVSKYKITVPKELESYGAL
jgi:hypothetical protein